MIVCHCHAVCDRTIRACARAGVTTVQDVGEITGAGRGCGGCADLVAAVLEEERGQREAEPCPSPRARRLPLADDSLADVA